MSAHHNELVHEIYTDEAVRLGIRLYRYGLKYADIAERFRERGLEVPAQKRLSIWDRGETMQSRRILKENPGLWP